VTAGALHPRGALGDAAVLGDVYEVRLERFQAVEIGLDRGDVRLVLRGERRIGCRPGGQGEGRGGGAYEGAAEDHAEDVAYPRSVCQCWSGFDEATLGWLLHWLESHIVR